MKNTSLTLSLVVGLLLAFSTTGLFAKDAGKQTTLTGTMVCGKCKLHITKECQDVLQVEKDGKTVNYFLTMNKPARAFHPNICQNDGEKVTVIGKVKEKDGKETMVATKITPTK